MTSDEGQRTTNRKIYESFRVAIETIALLVLLHFHTAIAKAINPHHSFKARLKITIASITLILSILVSSILGYVTSD